MIAENKQEFFEQLERELQKLGVEDTGELMGDLEEHFAEGERRGVSEDEICRELGSISEIARSCLDLKSTAINSMVARDVERKKGVSLTKPGRSVPADPSLAEPTLPIDDTLPSYTPEHISGEIYPDAGQSGTPSGAVGAGAVGASAAGASAVGTGAVGAGAVGASAVGASAAGASAVSAGGSDNTANSGTSDGGTGNSASAVGGSNGGTFEKVGKAVDVAFNKAGKAINDALGKAGGAVNEAFNKAGSSGMFRPSDSYREHINNGRNGGAIPPQYTKVKGKGGSKFVDTSGMTPNVNGGRLATEILLDIFLWSWLVPLVFSLVLALGTAVIALTATAVACLFGNYGFVKFRLITRVLFSFGFINAAAAVFCLACLAVKAPIGFVKDIISRHIKAIYDI